MRDTPPLVVVLDRSEALVRSLAKAVDGLDEAAEVHLFTRASEIDVVLAEGPVDVLLIGPSELTPTGLRRVARWHNAYPATVVVVAAEKDALPASTLLVKAGVERLLKLPAGPAAVRRVLADALVVVARRRAALATTVTVTAALEPDLEADAPEEPVEQVAPEAGPHEPAVTITVSSATGGCGKTFLATNLAYLLAQGTTKRVAMIDLDLQFGELVPTLRLKPLGSIADVVLDDEGQADVSALMTPHAGGFDVLAAPPDPIAADRLDFVVVRAALEALRQSYDFVIVDTPPTLSEVVLDAFDVSDHLLVLATLDVSSVRNMKVFLSTLERLRIRQDGIHLVLNKAERDVELSSADVQKVLGRKWDLELPYDREVSRSVNLGLPVSEVAPRSEVSRRLVAGIFTLVPGADIHLASVSPEPSGLARLLSLFRRRRTPLVVEEKAP